ncbi:TetR/AcrR family transcriptional regulator [Leptospira licerasiae]|uniref:Transcriptional regulator, TetR family n=1 Tax=Leptospira licerasiae str. MMD4847 TaxID=1049971 RepID=A0ABN0HAY1_9LEPT|nr:TetR/AcrR family transcriptional regulator [Leptospira licerasiae]EIE02276.1 transcriptional regulator, TetR family [Leptospira licerasiae serovar Varillal str. VAR 010]EJZ42796.1 transcriptional regulator, TetR family [Leptospira licerasiae str. MMD4847]
MPAKKKMKKPEGSYHHGNLAEALKKLALKRLEISKDSAFTIREIAREAGVSHAAAYRHFPSHRDLLAQISKDGFIKITEEFTKAENASSPSDPFDRLRRLGIAYISFCLENVGYYRAMWHIDLGPVGDLQDLMEAGKNSFLKLWETILICESLKINKFEAKEMATAAWSLVHGYSVLLNECQLNNPVLQIDKNNALQEAEKILQILDSGLKNKSYK